MVIPRANISTTKELVTVIEDGILCNDLSLFYTSKEWRKLRNDILEDYKSECQDCKARGFYVLAVMVHHEKEVRDYPALALSKTYIDGEGMEQRQLTPLCDDCHKSRHFKEIKLTTIERWD